MLFSVLEYHVVFRVSSDNVRFLSRARTLRKKTDFLALLFGVKRAILFALHACRLAESIISGNSLLLKILALIVLLQHVKRSFTRAR